MRRIPIDFLISGATLGYPVYGRDGKILLSKGTVLTDRHLLRLKEIGVPGVFIEDSLSAGIRIDDLILEETRIRAVTKVEDVFNRVKSDMLEANAPSSLGAGRIKQIVGDMLEQLMSDREVVMNLIDIRTADQYLFSHSVNVCILSMLTAINLGYNRRQLMQLGIGALLHDIGKVMIPPSILQKPGMLGDEEFEVVKKHPEYSLFILSQDGHLNGASSIIVYQHHERCNGSGYPLGLNRNNLHEMAQIVGMADVYDALTADRTYRKALPPDEAYMIMAGMGGEEFSLDLARSFLSLIAAYPAGTIIQLNNGEIAIVTSSIKGYTLLPRVKILLDPYGMPCKTDRQINLWEQNKISVRRVIPEEFNRLIYNRYINNRCG